MRGCSCCTSDTLGILSQSLAFELTCSSSDHEQAEKMSALDSGTQQRPAARRVSRGQCPTGGCQDHCRIRQGYANLGSLYPGWRGDCIQRFCVSPDCQGYSACNSRSCSGVSALPVIVWTPSMQLDCKGCGRFTCTCYSIYLFLVTWLCNHHAAIVL